MLMPFVSQTPVIQLVIEIKSHSVCSRWRYPTSPASTSATRRRSQEASGGQDKLRRRATLRGARKCVVEHGRHEQTDNPRDIHTAERLDQWSRVERRRQKGDLHQDP